ncbi:MAG: hypothetical protein LBJ14_08055 [Desulfarculales bacterium]|jgi:hypothetical protein|nr:hypothetical protein [Desulfarculales bacterium]
MARKTPSAQTVTSRSLTISTANFYFDLTWRKVETEIDPPSPPPAPPLARADRSSGPDFAEILNRKQIGRLLGPLAEPPGAARLLPVAPDPLTGPSRAEVCGQYRRVALWTEEEER